MLRAEPIGCAADRADRHRDNALPARHETKLRQLVDDGVACGWQEIAEHDLDDRSHPSHCHSESDPDEAVLADRRVADPLATELLREALVRLEHAAGRRDVLADQDDRRIRIQLVFERSTYSFAVREFGDGRLRRLRAPVQSAWTQPDL